MRASSTEGPPRAAPARAPSTTRRDDATAVDIFARLPDDHVHPGDADLTRDFYDGLGCPLCRAGWCVQRVTDATPDAPSEVVHGLALH